MRLNNKKGENVSKELEVINEGIIAAQDDMIRLLKERVAYLDKLLESKNE